MMTLADVIMLFATIGIVTVILLVIVGIASIATKIR